ncbi:MAG: GNAT family N-acetyltransferase, partial [Pseudomonadota bacterium]
MSNLIISELPPLDSSSIVHLVKQVQQIHVEQYPDVFRSDIPEAELVKFLEDWLSNDNVTALIATDPEQYPIGYLIYEIQIRGKTILKKSSRTCFIHHIAVDESYRKKGIAKELIKEMKQRIKLADLDSIAS